ncbi:hypothetical protein DID88_004400 [Monilinia fructigena]|uniref:Integrase catalytic domain-containing protein n=1 Tax=Monilinia fructigena TaxID=38457 RepID=A0A395IW30_9HELO|nr:hypothetical protein DID88_004400 [Monilinia fructigena]
MATHSPTQFPMATAVYNKLEEGDQVDYCDDWYETVLTYDVITREIDKKDFSRYIKYKRKVYAEEDICDDDLAEVFHEDFKLFTKNEFATVHQLDARQLRKTLRIKGLNITMSGADAQSGLYEQAQRTNSVPWTMEQAKEIMKGDDFNTIKFSSKKIEKMIKDGNERDDDNPPDDDDDPDDEDGRGGRNSRGNRRERSNDGKDRKNSPYVPNALLNLQKFYSPDEKYEGDDDNFDYKLSIFYEIARRAELPTEQFYQAFPMMLKGSALSFYHSSRDDLPDTFKSLCEYMKQEFEGVQYERNMLAQWNAITLTTVRKSNKDKTLGESFNIMAKELRSLQMRLQKEMRDPIHMHNKLMLACQGVPACDFACFNPAKDVPGFIQQLKQAIATWEKSHKNGRFDLLCGPKISNTQSSYSRNNSPDTRAPQGRNNNFVRKCWICKKEGCRSTKHTPQEQEEHKQKWRNRFSTGSNNSFKKRYDQWLVEVEGEEEEEDRDQEMATFFSVDGRKVVEKLATCALQHALFGEKAYGKADGKAFEEAFHTSEKYSDKEFFGICIDTGAARRSTVGNGQFKAWQKVSDAVIDTSRAGAANVKFGKEKKGRLRSDLLTFRCLLELKIAFDNRVNILHTPDGEFPVYRRNDHPFLLWKINFNGFIQDSIQRNECYLTDVDLRQLHRRFGHPSARKFHKVLQRAGYDESHSAIKHLTKYCEHCQLHGKSPGRFKFSLQDDTEFNHTILVDVMYIANQPILHIVDEATRYQAARWLENMTAKNAWDALRACWIDVYVGPPDYIVHDAGKNFFSKEFTQNATSMAIATKCVPVEAHNSIGLVERYHKPLKRAYHIINEEMSGFELAKDMILQMAVKAINDTVGPDGIVPTLLVYGTYPRMTTIDAPAAIKGSINAIIKPKKQIPLVICIDSKSLYELLTKLGTTAEKRLMIDIMSLRQSYERREITEIKWIDGNSNPADAMTKDRPCQALKDLIDTNKLIIKESQWVERGD